MFSPKPLIFLIAFILFIGCSYLAIFIAPNWKTESAMPGIIAFIPVVLCFLWMVRLYQKMWGLDWRFRNTKK